MEDILRFSGHPRQPLSKIWRVVRSLQSLPQQIWPFRAVALHQGRSELEVAEDYCSLLTFRAGPVADSDDADPVKHIFDKCDELYHPYKNAVQAAAMFNLMEQKPDQGPPFDSEAFKAFLQQWDIVHEPSSPLYARSNGQMEPTIQTVKSMLIKSCSDGKDLSSVLRNYRATPTTEACSPAGVLMSRKWRPLIPTLPQTLKPLYLHYCASATSQTPAECAAKAWR
ncbi:hypothetical protein MTO96_011582 [Rhipicephalus appendiculatus]